MRAYAQSKLALVMFTFDLAGQLHGTGVTANCLHPATLMDTKIVFEAFGSASSNVQEGADATAYLIAHPDLREVTGPTSRGNVRHAPKSRPTTWRPGRGCGRCRRN